MKSRILVAVVAALALLFVGAPAEAKSKAKTATVYSWSDGDTVSTSAGVVRLVGIDTPEVGVCGADQASALARQLAPAGSQVKLLRAGSGNKTDRYGRLLRYVKSNGVDVGLAQIRAGAVARYDSLDGYPTHPKQKKYRKADARSANFCGGAVPFVGGGGGSYPPSSLNTCPSYAPIKGNRGSSEWIYHVQGGGSYNVTNPEECFATETDALNAGYRRALN